MMHDREITMTASAFKAQCLDVMARIASHKLSRVIVTKRGLPVAVLGPVTEAHEASGVQDKMGYPDWWGCMRGTLAPIEEADWQALDDVDMPEPDVSKLLPSNRRKPNRK